MRRIVALGLAAVLLGVLVLNLRAGLERLEANRIVWTVQRRADAVRGAGRAPGAFFVSGVQELRRAIRLDPVGIEARAMLGDLYLFTGREESAVRVYGEALELEVRAEPLFNRGLALWSLGREEAALESFEPALTLDPRLRPSLPPGAARRLR